MVRNKKITPIQQLNILKHEFPLSKGKVSNGTMVWHSSFQPSALSDTYNLKIVYNLGSNHKAYIDSPKPLRLATGAKILPHTFDYHDGKQRLCLYLPHEWDSSMLLSTTIVHWAIQWMYYYEIWASTGKWLGGGHGNWDVDKSENNSSNYA